MGVTETPLVRLPCVKEYGVHAGDDGIALRGFLGRKEAPRGRDTEGKTTLSQGQPTSYTSMDALGSFWSPTGLVLCLSSTFSLSHGLEYHFFLQTYKN